MNTLKDIRLFEAGLRDEERQPYPAIYCYECGKQLRGTTGAEWEDIHTASNGEDVCEACCDVCEMEEASDLEDAFDLLMGE